ncbi:MAG: inosine/xanthosine triphosphatase [Candidatus Woesearchaeota archaeon]
MIIKIGSNNPNKVDALKEALNDYDFISDPEVTGVEVPTKVSDQPKSLAETMQGAMNRAKGAFQDCELSFGIEDGIVEIPNTKSGYMNACICAIYDGKQFHLGLGSMFEYPPEAIKIVLSEDVDLNNAVHRMNMTDNPRVGHSEGIISLLTKGIVDRKEYTKQAIRTAMIHLQNKDLY